MAVRKATTGDIDGLVKLRMEYLAEDHGCLSAEEREKFSYQLPEYFKKHLGKDLIAFVATKDSEVVATAFLLLHEKPASPRFPTGLTGTLMNVYTKPEYRRKGIAFEIVEKSIEHAKELGVSFIELKATKDGLHLYQKLGFRVPGSENTAMKLNLF